MIKSICYSDQEIINNILSLHVPNKVIDLDPTYSKGNFYKSGVIPQPLLKYDISPISGDISYGDCRNLPLESNSLNSILFDPPFLATKGRSLLSNDDNNKINKRFGVYPTEVELHDFYDDSLKEFYRLLNNNGILMFKCQDKVSSGKQYFSHIFIHNKAMEYGFYPLDLFVLVAKNRIVADWQRNQKHCRKYHCYYWVFKKTTKIVRYF